MGNAATRVVGAVVVVAVAFSAGSFWVGSWVEEMFRDSAETAAQHGFKVTVIDYQRGVFGAVARTEVVFPGAAEDEPVTMQFNHSIRHGSVPIFTAAARIRSEPLPSGDAGALLNDILGSSAFADQPLVVESAFEWGGGHTHQIVLPRKFEETFNGDAENRIRLSWDEIDGIVKVYAGQGNLRVKLDIGSFSLGRSANDRFQIERVSFESEIRPDGEMLETTAKLGIGRISTEGNLRKTIDEITFEGEANMREGTLDVTAKLAAAAIVREEEVRETIDNARMTLVFEHLDVEVLKGIVRAVLQADDEQSATKILQEQWTMLLHRQPTFAIRDAGAHWPEGDVAGNFRIGYSGAGVSGLDDISLANVAADWQLSLPRALAARFVGEQMYEDEIEAGEFDDGDNEGNSEFIRKPTAEQIDRHIAAMLEDGTVVENEKTGMLSLEAVFRKGELILNGKTTPIESLLILSPF